MESSRITIALLLLCGLLLAARTAYGCMCARSHPQESLCSEGSFAALVKIRNVEYVYMTERPKHKMPKTDTFPRDGKDEKASLTDLKKMDDSDQNTKQEMERVEVVVKDIDQLSQNHFVASYIRYRVKVYETYKGLKPEEVEGKKIYIYTAPYGSLCGAELKAKEMYLLIGNVNEDRLTIGLCNNYFMWNSLDLKQRRVIRRNMRAAKSTCESKCEIITCWSSSCSKPDKNACMWTSQMEKINNKLNIHPANFACAREPGKQDARCKWNDALTSDKRGLRRRRHHSSPRSESHLRESSRLIMP